MPLLKRLVPAVLLLATFAIILQYSRLYVKDVSITGYVADIVDDFLYPLNDGPQTLKCGYDLYKSIIQKCVNDALFAPNCGGSTDAQAMQDHQNATTFHLTDPPYDNYFYSDSHAHTQVVVTTPEDDSDLTIISPRLVVAWPAGNSGVCTYFQPYDGVNGSLAIKLVNSTLGDPIGPVYLPRDDRPSVGIKGVINLNSSAVLPVAILGSIRTIRDYVEGPSVLVPEIQDAMKMEITAGSGATISRKWFDNVTVSSISFKAVREGKIRIDNGALIFDTPGDYAFYAHYNHPQLDQLSIDDVLNEKARGEIDQHSDATESLSFLSYSDKILAGAWRFLTYFGRDSMISALLMESIFSAGHSHSALEAVLGAVLERINNTDGRACHEEVIGDYATWLNLKEGLNSTAYRCDYSMVDTEYYIPILMEHYLISSPAGQRRYRDFLATPAGKVDVNNKNLTWGDLALISASRIVNETAAFAAPGGQKIENMISLDDGLPTGNWRDSVLGLGMGRIPFDINTSLVPAALRAIAALSRQFNETLYGVHAANWSTYADQNADVWEDKTLPFFEITLPAWKARNELHSFVKTSTFYKGPSHANLIQDDVTYYAVSLANKAENLPKVPLMNSDTSFRLFFQVNTQNQTQFTKFINNTALSILRPFPAGLLTPVGMVVANPAYTSHPNIRRNFTNSAYHGTVIWGWQMAMMAKGLENQLDRCPLNPFAPSESDPMYPAFCTDPPVYRNLLLAYNRLWDVIESNKDHLSDEVWSWIYDHDEFKYVQLGSLPPAPGAEGVAESNVRQLWSLTFLAVKRDGRFKMPGGGDVSDENKSEKEKRDGSDVGLWQRVRGFFGPMGEWEEW